MLLVYHHVGRLSNIVPRSLEPYNSLRRLLYQPRIFIASGASVRGVVGGLGVRGGIKCAGLPPQACDESIGAKTFSGATRLGLSEPRTCT